MSSGSLPLSTYHRAQCLGSGTYGDVITVYDEDGNRLAVKLFQNEDEDDESAADDSEEEDALASMDIGALREISILRLLRSENSHPNIVEIHDFKQPDDLADDQDQYNGNDIMANMGLVMPFYQHGNLSDAIDSNLITNKRIKVKIAHGILSAVAYLHSNGIIHRDIKGDNILLDFDNETGEFFPVLIDFSLAKVVGPQIFIGGSDANAICKIKTLSSDIFNETTHTPEVGTPTYRAPEVVSKQPYHLASDMYSVGVVLLELLRGRTLEAHKDKESSKLVMKSLEELPDQPFANLVRGLLKIDPTERLSAKEALENEVFAKFGFTVEKACKGCNYSGSINIMEALPFDNYEENDPSSTNKLPNQAFKDKTLLKRIKLIRRIAHELECKNPLTLQAALMYSQQLSQLENCDDLKESQALCDCVVLAHKFFENEIWSLRNIENIDSGVFREFEWSAAAYVDQEATLLLLLDFCLYPRQIIFLE